VDGLKKSAPSFPNIKYYLDPYISHFTTDQVCKNLIQLNGCRSCPKGSRVQDLDNKEAGEGAGLRVQGADQREADEGFIDYNCSQCRRVLYKPIC